MATAKKKTVRSAAAKATFDLLDGPSNIVEQARESLATIAARRKNEPTSFRSLNDIKRSSIPLTHFYLQYAFGMAYLPSCAVIECLGAESIGKTTLAFTIAGNAAQGNVPGYYQETEGKPMPEEQIIRCLSNDRVTAKKIFDRAIGFDSANEIREGIDKFETWVRVLRGKAPGDKEIKLPAINPFFGVIDTISKWMAPGEAAGYQNYGENMTPEMVKKLKEVGTGSNLEHSKLFAAWCRRLPYFLGDNNGVLWLNSHQNAKIDMGGGGASYMSADAGKLYNKTKIGGNAFNQNAAIQIILAPGSQAKNGSGEVTGRMVKLRVDKNSYGPDNRVIEYELRNRYTQDSDTQWESPIRLDEGMAKWFADERILGTVVERKRYTCEALNVINGDGVDLSTALHANPEIMRRLAKDLKIRGYDDPVTEIETSINAAAPALPEDATDE